MDFDSSDPTYPVEVFLSVLEHEASAQGIDKDNGDLVAFAISFMVRLYLVFLQITLHICQFSAILLIFPQGNEKDAALVKAADRELRMKLERGLDWAEFKVLAHSYWGQQQTSNTLLHKIRLHRSVARGRRKGEDWHHFLIRVRHFTR